uniref:J domain-containing protein n=1 Tax=Strigamia maritima TaxID=126957 RepID=T1JJ41_STRMM
MEGNKDESERCLEIGEELLRNGQREKALKYLDKAERLYPSPRAKALIDGVKKWESSSSSKPSSDETSGGAENGEARSDVHRRKTDASSAERASEQALESDSQKHEYSAEQCDAVKRIKKCKDYYEILNVAKDVGDSELKKQYRKLALQFHPDKNKAPGASEAFKAIGNAFAVLSDAQKRKKYDLYGPEDEAQRRGRTRDEYYEYDYTRGFEAEMSAEELFNMFFGGGFPSARQGNVYTRRGGSRWNRYQSQGQAGHDNNAAAASEQGNYSALFQMLPILILIFLSLMSSFFGSEPAYSLQRTPKFSVERHTRNLRVTYFVKENFQSEYQGSIRRIEQTVEEDYITNLRASCIREKNYKENMLWRARNFGDAELYRKADHLKTPSCERLQTLYSS